jgi:hypothetical protein
MKKAAVLALVVVGLLLLVAPPSDAWGRARVFIGVGPVWWGPPHPWWYYPPAYYPPPVVYTPPPVIVQEPPVYVQQQPQAAPAPPPPPAPAPPSAFWYYCTSAKAYYPNVQTCPEPWVKVPPRPE